MSCQVLALIRYSYCMLLLSNWFTKTNIASFLIYLFIYFYFVEFVFSPE